VAGRKEKRGIVDSFLIGYTTAQQIVDKPQQLVVAANIDRSHLIVVPTKVFSIANISPLSMGSNSNASFYRTSTNCDVPANLSHSAQPIKRTMMNRLQQEKE
jgi:hypothetical protein